MDCNRTVHGESARLFQRQWKNFFSNVAVAKQDLEDHLMNCKTLLSRTRTISVLRAPFYHLFFTIRLLELLLLLFNQNITYCLGKMDTDTVILSSDVKTVKFENSSFTLIPSLTSSQEDTDIK